MPGFLFWNLHGQSSVNQTGRTAELCESLTRLVQRHPIDVLVFSECGIDDATLATALNQAGVGTYSKPESRSRRIQVWTRLAMDAIEDRYNGRVSDRITIREVQFPGTLPILLVGVHLRDRQTVNSDVGRYDWATQVSAAIRRVESRVGFSRTVLVGDLNMNPYEPGVVGPQGFHAVLTRDLAQTVTSLSGREQHPCFYNPMWSCFGDQSFGPAGTLFYPNTKEPTNHFWHLFDQMLLRPELIDQFVRVEILDGDGTESFVSQRGRPRTRTLSDHLPIYFEFDFTR